jgi:Zn-dependent protease with chaperone function
MKTKATLALILFAAPVLALAVSFLCEGKLDTTVRASIAEANPTVNKLQLREITSRQLIAEHDDAELAPIRRQIAHFDLMRTTSLALIAFMLVYFAALWLAGRLAVRNRDLLLRVFKPGYYVSSGLLAVATVVNAALLIAAIYYGESYLIGRIHVQIIALIGIGAIGGAYAVIRSVLGSRQRAVSSVFGKVLRETDHPAIWDQVRALAGATGALVPENIVLGLDPTFFVTEADVACLDGTLTGRTMFVSAPLARLLGEGQFRAVVAHELGHFKGKDTEYSQKFYPVYRGLGMSLGELEQAEGARLFAVLPTMVMLGTFLGSFAAAEARLSRERELAADAVAVGATDARAFAVALARIIVSGPYWMKIDKEMAPLGRGGRPLPNVSLFIAARALTDVTPDLLAGVGEMSISHPTDSHPPTGVRLEAVGMSLDGVKDDVLGGLTGPPAIGFIDGAEAVEESLSSAYRDSLARRYDLS